MKIRLTKKIIFLIAFILLLIIYWFARSKGDSFNIKYFDTEKITIGDIKKTISANGTINPVNVINVGTQVSGTIEKIFTDYNDTVKKGQKLAELDTAILKKDVLTAESSLKKAKANLDLVELNYQRTKELFKNNYIAKVELDSAETELKNAKEEYNIANTKFDVSKINLNYAFITSPVSGVVISREVDIGQTVASNFSAPTLFKIAEDLTKMQIETSVSEADIGAVKEGQPVQFTVDSFQNKVFDGVIKQIRLNPTTESNVVVYNVIIEINNKNKELMPGMTAYVTIPIGEAKNVKKINTVTLRFNPDAKLLETMKTIKPEKIAGKLIVYKLLKDNKIIPIYIEIGLSDLGTIEIKSDELQEGDLLISNSTLINLTKKK